MSVYIWKRLKLEKGKKKSLYTNYNTFTTIKGI